MLVRHVERHPCSAKNCTALKPAPVCHVVHLVYRFVPGGLENVIVQLIHSLPRKSFRHTVIALADIDPDFAQRVEGPPTQLFSLNKPPGQPFFLYPRFYRLLRRLRPDVLHSCNLAALEFMPIAALAGVPLRIHSEHGMDIGELRGKAFRYGILRRLYSPFVSAYVAVSNGQAAMLKRIAPARATVHLIHNGVDVDAFRPRKSNDPLPSDFPFLPGSDWIVGTVGRQVDIKNPLLLVDAFIAFTRSEYAHGRRPRLVMVGDGDLHNLIAKRMRAAGMEEDLWLPGARADIADIMRSLDCFVLPSLSEATSCTLLEAMASALPIVATDVGGTAAVLAYGQCGALIPSGDAVALGDALRNCYEQRGNDLRPQVAFSRARTHYGLPKVAQRYAQLFTSEQTNAP